MPACLEAMEEAYRELGEGKAGYRPRIDFYNEGVKSLVDSWDVN